MVTAGESRCLFSGPGCVCSLNCSDKNQFAELTSSLISLDLSASNGAIFARGGVLKHTLVVDNDTTVHGVHTNAVAFSLSVLIKCSNCSYHPLMRTLRMNGSRKRPTSYDTESYCFIMVG